MPMDFREYLILVDQKEDREEPETLPWNNFNKNGSAVLKTRPVRDSNEKSPSPVLGVKIPTRARHRSDDVDDLELSKSAPSKVDLSDFENGNGSIDLYGNSPPLPTLNSNPWDRFTAVTSPTKVVKAPFATAGCREQRSGKSDISFDLWGDDEEDASPPDSPEILEKPPHISRLKSLSCPPHWPVHNDQGDDKHSCPKRQTVSFADDFGLPLTSVRFFTESPNDPPKSVWKRRGTCFRTMGCEEDYPSVGGGGILDSGWLKHTTSKEDQSLQPEFEQPVSNFVEFMKKLDANCVCLENVAVKDECEIVGTIRVKNMGFEKSVLLRITFNDWETYCDAPAWFSGVASRRNVKTAYDTFSFRTKVPLGVRSVGFAVKYRVSGQEYWDSNGGKNYRMARKL